MDRSPLKYSGYLISSFSSSTESMPTLFRPCYCSYHTPSGYNPLLPILFTPPPQPVDMLSFRLFIINIYYPSSSPPLLLLPFIILRLHLSEATLREPRPFHVATPVYVRGPCCPVVVVAVVVRQEAVSLPRLAIAYTNCNSTFIIYNEEGFCN